ncbi:MAG: tyrosine-type recombinase/integrase [Ancalomicrobiaceae bacterium]|nr:tyrosine-type recombinase/integrase [Ancalomicrobiaceae bacterium]
MRVHLTEIAVRALKPEPGKQFKVWDTATPGFGVLVGERSKSWIVMHGARRALKVIGRFPDASLATARAEAKRILATGSLAHAAAHVVRFDEAFAEYIDDLQQRSRPSTARDYKRLIARHFDFGSTPLPEITPQRILKQLDKIKHTPSEQRYALVALKIFMTWCQRRFYLNSSPCAQLQARGAPAPRERVLTDTELATVLLEARNTPYPFGAIVELLIFTGQRRGEIAALRWEWIDDEARTITLPSSITKNKRAHTFPYGDMVAAAIATIPRFNEYVFPAARDRLKEKPATIFNGWSKPKVKLDKACSIAPWTLHDLRRTFATNLAALGTPIHITEKLLNHVSGTISGVAAVYNRHAYMDEMRAAITAWERHLDGLLDETSR